MTQKLSKKEKDFCAFFCEMRSLREAAYRAGYKILPEKSAAKLLKQERIINEIKNISESRNKIPLEVEAGYRRLAFGSVADAVKLIFAEEASNEQLEALDLFLVSDIKKPKGGGIEIKFFDRLKALEHLEMLESGNDKESALGFYKALENSAIKKDESDGEYS